MEKLCRLLDSVIRGHGTRDYTKYLRAKEKLALLREHGADDREIAKAQRVVDSLTCGVLEGGPLDGKPTTRKSLKSKLRYFMLPTLIPTPMFNVYEKIRGTDRYVFVRSFTNPLEYDMWAKLHPQEKDYD
jgi:hypothetical protein